MRFLIYIPSIEGDVTPQDEKLTKVGLPALARGCATIATPQGPDGKPGVVFSWPTNDPRSVMGYLPALQEWIPAAAVGDLKESRYWVGFVKNLPPTPQDLAWPNQLEGDAIALGDGRTWTIPAAGMLPKSSRYTSEGWGWSVLKEFEDYWNDSCQWYLELITKQISDDGQTTVAASCCDYLTRALSMNYMLTPEVVSHLGLFNTRTIGPALRATVHGITLRAEQDQKKTDDIPPVT